MSRRRRGRHHDARRDPHVLRGTWVNDDPGVRDRLILRLNALLAGRPSVLAGCEYFFSSDAVELLERGRGGPLTGLNRSRYLLLEFRRESCRPRRSRSFTSSPFWM